MTHGIRRAAEMRESAKTVAELGLMNAMTNATVEWQQLAGDMGIDCSALDDLELDTLIDAALSKTDSDETKPIELPLAGAGSKT